MPAALVAICASCSRREPLPVLGETGYFRLTADTGLPFESTALRGKIWVADFIFTNCQGPCPRMTALMKRLEEQSPAVQLVSFTVDPARDSPEVLAA
jgi:protein SCO1/2